MIAESVRELLKQLESLRKTKDLSKREMAKVLDIPFETFRPWIGKRKREPNPCRQYLKRIKSFIVSQGEGFLLPRADSTGYGSAVGVGGVPVLSDEHVRREAEERAERIKHLLLVIESELRYFRDGEKRIRDVFREMLDPKDIGYVSSLLGMLGDEDKFGRWRTFTTNKFRFFQKRKEE